MKAWHWLLPAWALVMAGLIVGYLGWAWAQGGLFAAGLTILVLGAGSAARK